VDSAISGLSSSRGSAGLISIRGSALRSEGEVFRKPRTPTSDDTSSSIVETSNGSLRLLLSSIWFSVRKRWGRHLRPPPQVPHQGLTNLCGGGGLISASGIVAIAIPI